MRRWIRLAVGLYPSGWRNRYGAEFGALLEDIGPSWRDFWDVLRGAIEMQVRVWNVGKIAAACGLVGALIAAGVAFRMEDQYLSSATLRVNVVGEKADDGAASEQITKLTEQVLSRGSLSGIIQKEDLYKVTRQREPLEDIVQNMRNRDIRISSMRSPGKGTAFIVQFRYPDANVAQHTTRRLISMMESDLVSRQITGRFSANVEVLDPASLPGRPISPNRRVITVLGLIGGLMIGSIFGLFKFRSKTV